MIAGAQRLGPLATSNDREGLRRAALESVAAGGVEANDDSAYCYWARIAASQTRDGASNFRAYEFVRESLRDFHGQPA